MPQTVLPNIGCCYLSLLYSQAIAIFGCLTRRERITVKVKVMGSLQADAITEPMHETRYEHILLETISDTYLGASSPHAGFQPSETVVVTWILPNPATSLRLRPTPSLESP